MSEQDKSSKSKSYETMPSTSKSISNITRIQRNVAEKQRRDKLNGYISELANIVPMVSMSSKRLDKTSILRLSAAHLRLSKSPLSGTKKLKKTFKWCPSFLTAQQVREILESVDGFLIVTSSSGKILFTSGSVERYLGHQNIDMIGHSLFIFIHPEDLDTVKEEMERLLTASLKCEDSKPAPRCSFRCRMKEKGQPRSEVATYQFVHFAGDMTISNDDEASNNNIKSTAIVTHIFKAFVRIVEANPYSQLSLEDACADEYITRHSLDGTIIFADHRLSTITGHLPQEVISFSAYKYILPEDISIALFAHHLMFSSDKGTGMVVYRLRTRDDKYVYLKSVGCLQFDRATSQVDHFVCVNQHLSDAEGEAQLKYFVDRFIPHIRDSSELTLFESVKALQVTGLKAPNSVRGIKDPLCFNKISTANDSKRVHSNIKSPNLLMNSEASKVTFVHTPDLSGSLSTEVNYDGSPSKATDSTRKLSNPVNTFLDRNYSIEGKSNQNNLQFKEKCTSNKVVGVNKKKRANENVSIKMTGSGAKTIASCENSMPDELLLSPQVKLPNSSTTMKIQSTEGLRSLQAQNTSIKNEVSCTVDNLINNTFNVETKRSPYENHTELSSNFQELSNQTQSQIIHNSISDQIHVSGVTVSNILKEGSFQISQVDDSYNKFNHYSMKKECGIKISMDSKTNSANICSVVGENFPSVKSNILLSTGSVVYNSESNMKILKPVVRDSTETIKLGNVSLDKVKCDSNQLATNINDVVMETNLWPADSSSESSASNAVSEETFVSSIEGCGNDPNLYFMPEEEMKDYLESSDDISSILNSSLPFDDSSLPSVDGWSECFRPEDVLNTTNAEISVHVETGNNL